MVSAHSAMNPHASRVQLEHGFTAVPVPIRPFPQSISDVLPRQHASESICTAAPDGTFNYGSALLNDGLLLLEFKDAMREGDGPRTLAGLEGTAAVLPLSQTQELLIRSSIPSTCSFCSSHV